MEERDLNFFVSNTYRLDQGNTLYLPKEISEIILSHLSLSEKMTILRLLSRTWRDLCESFYQELMSLDKRHHWFITWGYYDFEEVEKIDALWKRSEFDRARWLIREKDFPETDFFFFYHDFTSDVAVVGVYLNIWTPENNWISESMNPYRFSNIFKTKWGLQFWKIIDNPELVANIGSIKSRYLSTKWGVKLCYQLDDVNFLLEASYEKIKILCCYKGNQIFEIIGDSDFFLKIGEDHLRQLCTRTGLSFAKKINDPELILKLSEEKDNRFPYFCSMGNLFFQVFDDIDSLLNIDIRQMLYLRSKEGLEFCQTIDDPEVILELSEKQLSYLCTEKGVEFCRIVKDPELIRGITKEKFAILSKKEGLDFYEVAGGSHISILNELDPSNLNLYYFATSWGVMLYKTINDPDVILQFTPVLSQYLCSEWGIELWKLVDDIELMKALSDDAYYSFSIYGMTGKPSIIRMEKLCTEEGIRFWNIIDDFETIKSFNGYQLHVLCTDIGLKFCQIFEDHTFIANLDSIQLKKICTEKGIQALLLGFDLRFHAFKSDWRREGKQRNYDIHKELDHFLSNYDQGCLEQFFELIHDNPMVCELSAEELSPLISQQGVQALNLGFDLFEIRRNQIAPEEIPSYLTDYFRSKLGTRKILNLWLKKYDDEIRGSFRRLSSIDSDEIKAIREVSRWPEVLEYGIDDPLPETAAEQIKQIVMAANSTSGTGIIIEKIRHYYNLEDEMLEGIGSPEELQDDRGQCLVM